MGVKKVRNETNPERILQLKECCDLLLAGGYFRARIPTLSPFDKVVGGMVWSITASGEDAGVDVLFQENSTIGERIKLSENLAKALFSMKCPDRIQAHQIQGLDYSIIFPVMQWLVRKVIEHRARTGDLVRQLSEQQFGLEYNLPSSDIGLESKAFLSNLGEHYKPIRKFRRKHTARFADREARIEATLLEYGEKLAGTTIMEDEEKEEQKRARAEARGGKQVNRLVGSDDKEKEQEEKRQRALAEEEKRLDALKEDMTAEGAEVAVSGSGVGALVGMQADEIRKAKEDYEDELRKQKEEETGEAAQERAEQAHARQVAALSKKIEAARVVIEKATPEHDELQEQADGLKAALSKKEAYIAKVLRETAKLEEKEKSSKNAKLLGKLRALVLLNESLKSQEKQFKGACTNQRAQLLAMIAGLDDDKSDEEKKIDSMYDTLREKLDKLVTAGAKRNQEIAKINRAMDDIPARAELLQFERRFVELYGLVQDKLVETRKYYAMYNTLQTSFQFMENEVSLLDSIIEGFPKAMKNKTSKASFLASLQGIVANVEASKAQVDDEYQAEATARDTLSQKHAKLLEKQRRYFKCVKEFQEECFKNEKLSDKLGV